MGTELAPAPLVRRIAAGVIDGAVLAGLSALYFLIPLLTSGLVLPMWGVLLAGIGYAIVPLSAFRATLGLRLLGLEVVGKDGRGANPGDLIFRELLGRGLLPGAFLFTLAMSFVGSALGITRFAIPTGVGLLMTLASLAALAIVGPGQVLPLIRPDRRSLADLLARTYVVPRRPRPPPDDEDERAFARSQHRRKVIGVVVFEGILIAAALALPRLLTARTTSTEAYAERLNRTRLEKEFGRSPENDETAQNLAEAYRRANRPDDAERVTDQHYRVLLDRVGCDQALALHLGDRLNGDDRYAQAIELVKAFQSHCAPWPRLWWVSIYAHQQKEEWKEVAAEATHLIDNDPEDSDFWWWRGEAYGELKQYEQAAADYHQSLAQEPNGFAMDRYARIASKQLSRPCEAAFALTQWIDERGDDVPDWAGEWRASLYWDGKCAALKGTGRARLAPEGVPVILSGQKGALIVSETCAYTVVSRAFAERAHLDLTQGATIQVRAAGAWKQATLATAAELKISSASAKQVRVAVVDELPEGVDALLGANFLWRFRRTDTGGAWALAPWPH